MASLRVRVNPRSGRRAILEYRQGVWRVALTSPPEGGKANAELIELLAKTLRVPKGALELVSGAKARDKVVRVDGLSEAEAHARLEQRLATR